MFIFTVWDVIGLTTLITIVLLSVGHACYVWLLRKRCPHESYYENRECHAICRACHKDLGFIGSLPKRR